MTAVHIRASRTKCTHRAARIEPAANPRPAGICHFRDEAQAAIESTGQPIRLAEIRTGAGKDPDLTARSTVDLLRLVACMTSRKARTTGATVIFAAML